MKTIWLLLAVTTGTWLMLAVNLYLRAGGALCQF